MGSDLSCMTEYEDREDKPQIGFQEEQVELLKGYFKKMCKEHQIVLDQQQFIKENEFSEDIGQKIFFGLFDIDQNKQCDFYEFLCAMAQLNSSDLTNKAKMIFPVFADGTKKSSTGQNEKTITRRGFIQFLTTLQTQINKEEGKPGADDDKIEKDKKDLIDKYFIQIVSTKDLPQSQKTNTQELFVRQEINEMDLLRFTQMIKDEIFVHQGLFTFGLISKWGGGIEIEEFDPALQDEQLKFQEDKNDRIEAIKNGIEIEDEEKELVEQKKEEKKKKRDWQLTVEGMQPANYKKKLANPPPCLLDVDQIYGFRCNDTRNNIGVVEFGNAEQIVYHQASVGIVTDLASRKQQYFMEHNDDISCMDVYSDPGKQFSLVASGQFGTTPLICVWQLPEICLKVGLRGLLQDGIQALCFNSTGKWLAASANDENHCIAIYDIDKCIDTQSNGNMDPKAGVIAYGKNSKEQVWQLRFSYDDKTLIAACKNEVGFFSYTSGTLRKTKGILTQKSQIQSALCIASIEVTQQIFTGMFLGQIYVWDKAQQVDSIRAHSGPVTAMCERVNKKRPGLITGGNDEDINIWYFNPTNQKLQLEASIDMDQFARILSSDHFHIANSKISAITETSSLKLVIGTRNSDIFVVNAKQGFEQYKMTNESIGPGYTKNNIQCYTRGHYDGKLKGLCVHPKQLFFYTCGEDRQLAKWDINKKEQVVTKNLDIAATCLCISKNCKWLIAGTNHGEVRFFNPENLKDIHEQTLTIVSEKLKFQGLHIENLKFSPNDDMIMANYDSFDKKFSLLFQLDNGNWNSQNYRQLEVGGCSINRMDFSKDSKLMRCESSKSQKIYFFNIDQTKKIIEEVNPQQVSLKDVQWDQPECLFTWETQGVWPVYSEGKDVNAVDLDKTGRILVTGDDYSKVKLYLYPCNEERAGNLRYSGHSSDVSNLKFSCDNNYIISLGGKERSIIQWKLTIDEEQFKQLDKKNQQFQQEDLYNSQKKNESGLFEEEEQGKGDQALAVKPFLFKDPTGFVKNPKKDNQLPNTKLQLTYAHGYRCFYIDDITRNMCKYVKLPGQDSMGQEKNQCVFATAGVGVVMDLNKETRNEQSFFQKHEEDIVCLAVHPKKQIIATGQMAQKGKAKFIDIFVWDAQTKEVKCRLNDFHRRAILYLQFSPDGRQLLSVGQDDDNSIAVHDWVNKRMVCNSKVDKSKVNALSWKSSNQFMTCGVRHIKFWQLNGQNLNFKEGSFGGGSFMAQTCGTYLSSGDLCVTGGADGNIYTWQGVKTSKPLKAHDKSVQSIVEISSTQVLSGGFDGKVVLWNVKGSQLSKGIVVADIQQIQTQLNFGVVSLDFIERNQQKRLLVATNGSEIYEGTLNSNMQCQDIQNHMQGHFEGELWGCCTNPSNPNLFVTAGDDKTVRLWDISERKMLALTKFSKEVRAVDWSQDGKYLVAADNVAMIYSLNPETLEIIDTRQSQFNKMGPPARGTKWVEDIKVSPDCKRFAFGAHGGVSHLELWNIEESGKLSGQKVIGTKIVGITSALLHLDWDVESQVLAINSQAYELKYINVNNQTALSDTGAKDIEYFTWTSKIGWCVQGIFQGVDYSDVNTTCRSKSKLFLATGDDDGKVNLFKYPVVTKKQVHQEYIGHSSHVTRVRFNKDDSYLVSTGGNDKTIFVWSVGDQKPKKNAYDIRKSKVLSQMEISEQLDEKEIESLEDAVNEVGIVQEKQKKIKPKKQHEIPRDDSTKESLFEEEAIEEGDEFQAVKPWVGAIKEPNNWKEQNYDLNRLTKSPSIQPSLYHVFGLRSKDTRNNVRYLSNGYVVYHAAALGIVMDPESKQQFFFTQHIDDITSFAMHPNSQFVATGEIGPKPNIFVWDAVALCSGQNNMKVINFKSPLLKGICSLSFSPSGKRLAAAAIDVDHTVAVYNIDIVKGIGSLIATKKGGPSLIITLAFISEDLFAAGGVKYYSQWSIGNNSLTDKKGQLGEAHTNTVISTISVSNNLSYCGTSSGDLLVFNGTTIQKTCKSHERAIQSSAICQNLLITGGKDGKIRISSLDFSPDTTQDITQIIKLTSQDQGKSEINGFSSLYAQGITSVYLSKDQLTLLFGTYSSEIHEVKRASIQDSFSKYIVEDISQKKDSKKQSGQFKHRVIMTGHYTPCQKCMNEVWGLALVPDSTDQFITCSDDGTLRAWSISEKQQIAMAETTYSLVQKELSEGKKIVVIDPSPKDPQTGDLHDSSKARQLGLIKLGDGHQGNQNTSDILVGMKDGTVKKYLFDSNSRLFKFARALKLSQEEISDIKFSPDKKTVCIGSHDNAIYALSYPELKQKFRPMKKHSSYITHIDFSTDGTALHSNCGAYELLFWDLNSGKQVPGGATAYRDEDWATWTCILGWPVQGIWPPCSDGTDINSVDRSHNQYQLDNKKQVRIVATADDFGKIKFYNYPCLKRAMGKNEKGFSATADCTYGSGHSSHVTNVRWTFDDKYIITSGGEDQCVIIWKVEKASKQSQQMSFQQQKK